MVKLVIVRHGQSVWNLENRFTGWIDVPLSEKGVLEAKNAGDKLKEYKFDIAFTSTLIRAQMTLSHILSINNHLESFRITHPKKKDWYSHFSLRKEDKKSIEVIPSEKLNERYYGDLQGLNKEETAKKYGKDQVHIWRRSFDIAPPNGESLKMTCKRTIPYFKKEIIPYLESGKNVIIAAHGNSLRSIVKYVENISDEEIPEYELKTGVPIVYTFDKNMKLKSKEVLE